MAKVTTRTERFNDGRQVTHVFVDGRWVGDVSSERRHWKAEASFPSIAKALVGSRDRGKRWLVAQAAKERVNG